MEKIIRRMKRSVLIIGIIVFGLFFLPQVGLAENEAVCVLEFQRLGGELGLDWMKRGLADMMITMLSRLSPYQVIGREHLVEVLKEHKMLTSGFVDEQTAFKQGRLAKAQLLLLGTFGIKNQRILIQVRLICLEDQQVISIANWEGGKDDVLKAPRYLCLEVLSSLGKTFDPDELKGIEGFIPRTIDLAQSYYNGLNAFDEGKYPDALSLFLDGVKVAQDFKKVYLSAIDLYFLLNEPLHSVLLAQEAGDVFRTIDMRDAMKFYFLAFEKAKGHPELGPLQEKILAQMIATANDYEKKSQEAYQTKVFLEKEIWASWLKERAKERNTPIWDWDVLRKDEIFYRMWIRPIHQQLADRYIHERPVKYKTPWIKVLPLSVWMWKTYAQVELARSFAKQGLVEDALQIYHEVFNDYNFFEQLVERAQAIVPNNSDQRGFYGYLKLEAANLVFDQYVKTGRLIRDKKVLSDVTEVKSGYQLRRDFSDYRHGKTIEAGGGSPNSYYESYRFMAQEGAAIEQIKIKGKVNGLIEFYFRIPEGGGTFKNVGRFKSIHSDFNQTISLPRGTQFVEIKRFTGPDRIDNLKERMLYLLKNNNDLREVLFWNAEFKMVPFNGVAAVQPKDQKAKEKKIIDYHVMLHGWENGEIHHQGELPAYTGNPKIDIYSREWMVFSDGRNMQIYQKHDPYMTVHLPGTINSDEDEYNPTLIKTSEKRIALIWSRATRDTHLNKGYFISFTDDFLHWETPRRMIFEEVEENFGDKKIWSAIDQEYSTFWRGPFKQSYHIFGVQDEYWMFMKPGLVRKSNDLVHWGYPQRVLNLGGSGVGPSTLRRGFSWRDSAATTITKTAQGRIWVVSLFPKVETCSPKHNFLPEWRRRPWKSDGRCLVGTAFIKVTTTLDGIHWTKEILIDVDRYNLSLWGIWSFPVAQDRIAVVLACSTGWLKWIVLNSPEKYKIYQPSIKMSSSYTEMEFHIKDSVLYCASPAPMNVGLERAMMIKSSEAVGKMLTPPGSSFFSDRY
ncbi:MAG: CsgG/HfaB family protein [Candidatus Omnitrophica bacterium]|nr:CsgG/HfaB family protein [Candidatus Omnitrophota bacterium]